jgi:hypothetical protein
VPIGAPLALFAVASCLTLAGCGGPSRTPVYKTAGKVTFQNQPIDGAFLVLHPKNSIGTELPRPIAHVKPDGTFEPTTFESGDGAPVGEYIVTVEWHRLVQAGGGWVPGPNLLPPKYASPATSDVVVQIAEGQNQLPEITLRR